MDKLTTGVAYGTSAGNAGFWALQLLDKVTPSQWAAIGVLGTAKEQIYNRFTLTPEGDEPLPGAVHFPNNPDIFDLTEAQQLTAEEQVEKWVDGRKKILWDSKKRRNEALDCFVYALAALRISISRWQLDLSALLASLQEEDGAATNKKTLADYARALSGEDE